MLENVIEFFKNLPAKTCTTCGEEIEEQHECLREQMRQVQCFVITKNNHGNSHPWLFFS